MLLRGLTYIFLITITLLLPIRTHACFMYEGLRKATSSHPIARGTIIDVHCRWNDKNTEIETMLSIRVDSSLVSDDEGEILQTVVPGGVLPEEGIVLIVRGGLLMKLIAYRQLILNWQRSGILKRIVP